MNTTEKKPEFFAGAAYFLSDMVGLKVFDKGGRKLGRLRDMAIREDERLPVVTHLIVKRPFGANPLLIPWAKVAVLGPGRIVAGLESIERYEGEPDPSQVLLNDHVMDKKVLDLDDNEVDVVYDIKLVLRNRVLYVTDVDFSRYALWKRLHLKNAMKFFFGGTSLMKKETLSWSYVQRLPEDIGRFRGSVKLKVLKEKLPEIHPVDLADILEELTTEQRLAIFNELETEHASDTLEEIEPRVQRELISSIKKERAAELINDMTPAQAADILAILPASDAEELLKLIDSENARKITFLLEKHEEKIINFSTSHFIKLPPGMKAGHVLAHFSEIAADMDEITYLYIVNEKDALLGVVDLKEVLKADRENTLDEIMTTSVISLEPSNTLLEAAEMFSRYSFRAIPITGEGDAILGIIPYRDIMNLKHRFV